MIKLILSGFVIFPLLLFSQSADSIVWSDKRLTWNNFKGNYDTAVYTRQHLATTRWKLQYQYKPELPNKRIIFIIYVWFDGRNSWVRNKSRTDKELLLHEQAHFDLGELFARQFKKQLSETNFSIYTYKDSISSIFNALLKKAYLQQETYDKETNYGVRAASQERWQLFVSSELKKLDQYQSKNLSVRLND